jgi:hypothetical protein
VRLEGRYWLIESVEPDGKSSRGGGREAGALSPHASASRRTGGDGSVPALPPRRAQARALVLDPRERPSGHWEVVDLRPARDEWSEIYLELIAERDFAELDELPDHELEHALARRGEEELPEGAAATLERAQQAGLSIELVALDPGDEPDWDEAERSIDALVLQSGGASGEARSSCRWGARMTSPIRTRGTGG